MKSIKVVKPAKVVEYFIPKSHDECSIICCDDCMYFAELNIPCPIQ